MATLTKHEAKSGKGTWKAKARRKGFPTRTQTFDTKQEAQEWARQVEHEMDRREHSTNRNADSNTLGDILTRYRDEVSPTHRGKEFETDRINVFLRHPITKLAMSKVTPSVLASWRDERLRSVSTGTVLREMTIIRAAINRARTDWGIDLKECPISRISKPKAPPPRDRRLVGDEEQRLYEACRRARNTYIKPAIAFAIETAMRQGEIVGLLWKNIDLTKRTARLAMTKSGKPRVVPLSLRAIEILMALPRDTEHVFEGLQSYSIKHGFVRLTKRAKMEDITFHDLRHEAISRLVERGLNLMEVAAISGHAGLDMLKRYTHLRAEDIALKLG